MTKCEMTRHTGQALQGTNQSCDGIQGQEAATVTGPRHIGTLTTTPLRSPVSNAGQTKCMITTIQKPKPPGMVNKCFVRIQDVTLLVGSSNGLWIAFQVVLKQAQDRYHTQLMHSRHPSLRIRPITNSDDLDLALSVCAAQEA